MRRLKSLFLILLALWLPLQTAGAAAMSVQFALGQDAQAGMAHQEMTHQGERCHLHDADASAEAAGDCDNCRICHLATAGFLLAPSVIRTVEMGSVLVALPTAALPSHIGDPPQQPPRRLN